GATTWMGSMHEPSRTWRNDSPALESRRVRTHPSTVARSPMGVAPPRMSTILVSVMAGIRACWRRPDRGPGGDGLQCFLPFHTTGRAPAASGRAAGAVHLPVVVLQHAVAGEAPARHGDAGSCTHGSSAVRGD